MGLMDVFWHLANFLAPAVGVGVIASGLVKLLWWRALRACSWGRLALWACLPAAGSSLACLMWLGRDGTMASYACLLLACSLGLAWAAFISPEGRSGSNRTAHRAASRGAAKRRASS